MNSSNYTNLNDEQKQAVEYNDGPMLIVAGAGTGKTTMITEKISYLVQKQMVKPEEILALTFTEKAAREMADRVDKAMPYGYFQMWICTFHSFADQILRQEVSHIGHNPDYKLMTQAETIMFLRKHLFQLNLKYFRPLGNPQKFLGSLLQHFSRLKDEDINSEGYINWANKLSENKEYSLEEIEKMQELAQAYHTYEELKVKEGYCDYSDLIANVLNLFRKRPSLLKKYQQMFRYTLVDEFQDTNIAQYALIKLLCPSDQNPKLTVVGDDSQAIYKFRGASVSNILNFMKDYPRAKQITLNKNYRSHQMILDAAYRSIQFNNPDTLESQLGISKKLIAQNNSGSDVVHFNLHERVENEGDQIVKQILIFKQKEQLQFSDFAILVRANNHADPFINALLRNGIPYAFLGPGMLFKQPEIKDLIAYLKVLYNLEDSVSFYRLLIMSIFNLDSQDIALLLAFTKKTNLSLYQSIYLYLSFTETDWYIPEFEVYKPHMPLLHAHTKEELLKIVKMIKRHLALIHKDSAAQILYYFLEDTSYLQQLIAYKTEKEEKIALNITKFFNKLKAFETSNEDASVTAVVDWVEMCLELGESPTTEETDVSTYDAVNIITVHGSKGLEFPVVFIVNLTSGRFPTYEKREPLPIPQELIKETLPQGDYHLQEERRLFYVAVTRAKNHVFLSSSLRYGEGKRERKISPFIAEALGEDVVKKYSLIKKEEKTQLSIFDFKKQEEPIVKEQINLHNFSYTQLESFDTCGLRYKYQYLLKIPTGTNAAASFGDTVHKTLQMFYTEFMKNKTIGYNEMLQMYHKLWIPLGYSSSAHENKMKKEGEELLNKYYSTFHHEHLSILGLEKLFKIRISSDIFLTGKIDRVDNTDNGGIEIIDYKTGKKPDDKELKKSLQLSIYALAAMDKGLYQKELEKVTLTFYYLQTMERFSMKRTPHDIAIVKGEVEETVTKIRANTFEPKVGPWCDFCPFRMICEAW